MSYASDHLAWKQRVQKERMTSLSDKTKLINIFRASEAGAGFSTHNGRVKPAGFGGSGFNSTLKCIVKQGQDGNGPRYESASIDEYGRIIPDSTYHTTNEVNSSPIVKRSVSLMKLRSSAMSPGRGNVNKLMSKIDHQGLYSSPRFPKAKPFFDQAYAPKSTINSPSQSRNKSGRLRHPKQPTEEGKSITELPPLKKKRFNEEIPDEASFKSKTKLKSKKKFDQRRAATKAQLETLKQLKKGLYTGNGNNANVGHNPAAKMRAQEKTKTEALLPNPSKEASSNTQNISKKLLLKSIELMDEKEMGLLQSALNNVHENTVGGELSRENLNTLNQIDDQPGDYSEEETLNESELVDNVEELPPLADKLKSEYSKCSSKYASELKSQIEEERSERVRIQQEIDQLKGTLDQIQNGDN
ncbi:unnamed protein product [Moneuplotes crassus]|uniref:Uncharacterized protein n=1 Tax=Euplotes crassus TaxID=5936 RepID=A0AAD1UGN5_EUPCR|nr:unnamed protein product [Moneuplotes crassus]